jgi:exosortase
LDVRNLASPGDPTVGVERRPPSVIDLSISVPVFVLSTLLGGLYWWIVRDMVVNWWEDPNYSHGFLVPVFSGYLIWLKRDELRSLRPRPNWGGFFVLLTGVAALILGVAGAENFLMRSSAIVILGGLVLFHLGTKAFRSIAFALAFLIFMVPLPQIIFNAVAFPLQTLAAESATTVLDFLGIPVLRDGNVIHFSRISLGVSEACSGIRSLISLLALAVAWGHLSLPGLAAQAALVTTALPITIVANTSRIVITGLIAHRFGIQYAEGFFHSFSGWAVFLVACACLAAVHRLISYVARQSRPGPGR